MSQPIIAVDFDGTIVTHEYPRVGRDIGALPWLTRAQDRGARLVLLTMRFGEPLNAAIEYCTTGGLSLWAVNDNPEQSTWTESRKVYAHLYIDDSGLGMPLLQPPRARAHVDWASAGPLLMAWLDRWRG
ncbi:MAG: hypothetical protein KJO07_04075 [Deltaproteobacteria bacterium]|nr:hypothetical protein [Deltaproteobacteria bacterium]